MLIIKKSTILVQSPSNLVKMIGSWVGNTAKISAKSEQNCGFFISNIFLVSIIFFESVSTYSCIHMKPLLGLFMKGNGYFLKWCHAV